MTAFAQKGKISFDYFFPAGNYMFKVSNRSTRTKV